MKKVMLMYREIVFRAGETEFRATFSKEEISMKKVIMITCIALLAAHIAAAQETVIVSGHFAFAPFSWREEEKLVGASIEIMERIFQDLGFEVDARYVGPWKRVLQNLEQGDIDVMCGLYETEERKQFAVFTDPFSEDRVSIFVWHDRTFPFETREDLRGKVFGEILGATRGKEFDEWRKQHATLVYVSDHEQNFKMLERGRIDCIVTSYYLGLMYSKKLGYEDKIVALDKPVAIKYLRYGISKRSPYHHYLPQINQKIAELREAGTLERIIRKHLDYYVATYLKE